MPDLESLFINILARFGDGRRPGAPTAGDLAAGEVAEWPEPTDAASLSSPYACTPTTWGVEEIPEPPAETEAEPPKSHGYDAPGRRLALSVDREPAPRGLLVT